MNLEQKIKDKSKLVLLKNPTVDDDVVELIELLYERIDELLETIEELRDQIYDKDEDEDIPSYSNKEDMD